MASSKQIPLRFPEAQLSFADLAITDTNRAICSAIQHVERWPSHVFCLIGPVGAGVTTLAHAWVDARGGIYLDAPSLQKLTLQDLDALSEQDLAIDDADALNDTRNLLLVLAGAERHKRRVLLTGHSTPSSWRFESPDLRSRLQSAPLAALPAPDEAMMRARLRKACGRSYLTLPDSVEDYLVTRLGLDYSLIEKTAEALAGASGERPLTIPLAREILGD